MIFPVVKSIKIQNIITLSQNLPKQLPRLNLFKKLSVAVVQIISKSFNGYRQSFKQPTVVIYGSIAAMT